MTTKTLIPVFIVENDNLFVKMLEYVFSKDMAYQFYEYKSAEDCLRDLKKNPSVIVIDSFLPGMDGQQAIAKIKKNNAATHVIMLLSDSDPKRIEAVLNAGADDYIVKDNRVIPTITERLEFFFNNHSEIKPIPAKTAGVPVLKAVCFFIILIILLSAGIYYYQSDNA